MFCSKCGIKNDDDATFCWQCGTELAHIKANHNHLKTVHKTSNNTASNTMDELIALATTAPVNFDSTSVDWDGVAEALKAEHVEPSDVLAVSWCSFGVHNIEALVDSPTLAIIHPRGVLASSGKRKMLSKAVKYDTIAFSMCRGFSPEDHTDERGLGKYCIEFVGAGGILLGRLQWSWRAKRFRDTRAQIMAVAEERDRIYQEVKQLLGV